MKSRSDRYFEGIVDHVNKKFCFIESEKFQKDTKVRNRNMNGAIHRDRVLFAIFKNDKKNKIEGKIIKVLERARNTFVGKIQDNGGFAFFIPDHKNIYTDFFIKKNTTKKYKENLKVILKVTKWNTRGKPEGSIIKILGKSGENETEF